MLIRIFFHCVRTATAPVRDDVSTLHSELTHDGVTPREPKPFPALDIFCSKSRLLIAGSSPNEFDPSSMRQPFLVNGIPERPRKDFYSHRQKSSDYWRPQITA